MERIRDLLDPSGDNLAVGEEAGTGAVYVKGAAEAYVTSPEEMFGLMQRGSENRAVMATGMNAGSSRSHSLFLITLEQARSMMGGRGAPRARTPSSSSRSSRRTRRRAS